VYCPIPTQKSIRRIGKSRVKILGYSNHATQPVSGFPKKRVPHRKGRQPLTGARSADCHV